MDLIVCTHNNSRCLELVLRSMVVQTASPADWAVTVVANRCTDDTDAVVGRFAGAGTIPGLRLIVEDILGLTPARVAGARATAGNWLAFVDDDCLLAVDWVAQAIAFAQGHAEAGAFGGRVCLDWEVQPREYVARHGWCFAEQEHGDHVKQVASLVGAGMVINRQALTESGWLDEQFLSDRVGKRLVSGGDVEIALRLAGTGRSLFYTPHCMINHLIPLRRTGAGYVVRMCYGLGVAQSLAEALSFGKRDYRTSARLNVLNEGRKLLRSIPQVLLRNVPASDWILAACFLVGRLEGQARVALLHKNLVGAAARRSRPG